MTSTVIGCCCTFEDDGETPIEWCSVHAAVRDERDKCREALFALVQLVNSCDSLGQVAAYKAQVPKVWKQIREALDKP